MLQSPESKRVRMHFATAVALLLATAGLTWLNVVPAHNELNGDYFTIQSAERRTHAIHEREFFGRADTQCLIGWTELFYGWPSIFLDVYAGARIDKSGDFTLITEPRPYWTYQPIFVDCATAIVLLWLVYRTCEKLIKKFSATKEASQPQFKWFQFHLSTAFVLMVTAGMLLCANTYKREFALSSDFEKRILSPSSILYSCDGDFYRKCDLEWRRNEKEFRCGWPYTAMMHEVHSESVYHHEGYRNKDTVEEHWDSGGIVANALVALLILMLVYFQCE